MTLTRNPTDAILKELREFGLAYPGAHTKSPWPGHLDLAVKDKTFAYLSIEGEPFGISCKLPHSSSVALMLPFTKPTEYGLGKSGWVSAKFEKGEAIPVELLKAWIDESYRAQAPKRLVASLPAATAAPTTASKAAAPKKGVPATKAARTTAGKAAAPKKGGPATKAARTTAGKAAAPKKGGRAASPAAKRSR